MRPQWKELVDIAVFSLEDAQREDMSQGGGYSESQYAAALLEALAKRTGNDPFTMVDCLSRTRHLIEKALERTYANYRKVLGPPKREAGYRHKGAR
jgi:hypothetical protein